MVITLKIFSVFFPKPRFGVSNICYTEPLTIYITTGWPQYVLFRHAVSFNNTREL